MEDGVQPPRGPDDGQVSINRFGDRMQISVTQDGETKAIWLSDFNAWRVFGMLPVFLGVALPKALAKRIRLV